MSSADSRPSVFITRRLPDAVEDRLRRDYQPILNADDHLPSADEVVEGCRGAEALVPCPTDRITTDVINRLADGIKVIASFSVGYEHIDIDAAAERGIVVTNTPDVLTDATADIAMLLILGAARLAFSAWAASGQALARRVAGFGMEVHYHNRSQLTGELEAGARFHDSIESLLTVSDILSIHCPSTPETLRIINEESLRLLLDGAIVVNTARGNVVDDDALIAALSCGKLFSAGLDVFDGEPNIHPGYRDLDNVFLLPHLGSATMPTRDAMGFRALDNLDAFFSGQEPPDRVA